MLKYEEIKKEIEVQEDIFYDFSTTKKFKLKKYIDMLKYDEVYGICTKILNNFDFIKEDKNKVYESIFQIFNNFGYFFETENFYKEIEEDLNKQNLTLFTIYNKKDKKIIAQQVLEDINIFLTSNAVQNSIFGIEEQAKTAVTENVNTFRTPADFVKSFGV